MVIPILIAFTTFFTIVLICFMVVIKDLKNDIKTLDGSEGYANDENNKLSARIDKLESDLYVNDFLVEIKEANGDIKILKSDAIKFKRKNIQGAFACVVWFYTSKENYENHKTLINKWEKIVKI